MDLIKIICYELNDNAALKAAVIFGGEFILTDHNQEISQIETFPIRSQMITINKSNSKKKKNLC
jgi:hypothetical protein